MKVLVQSYRDGSLSVIEAPSPATRRGRLLVRNEASLVSAGTERYQLELARKSLVGKALARPDLVAQVVRKARTDGVLEAWQQASQRLDVPVALGYSSAGTVVDVGEGVAGFAVGQRVACAGAGYASHAELVSVPALLCAPVLPHVSPEHAAFGAVGGVALEAVRMAHAQLGHRVVVIGLGLIGQIAVQLLRAAGCAVVGVDVSAPRAELARQAGADEVAVTPEEATARVQALTGGQGADATILLAAADSNAPLELAAEVTRERGRIVAAGLVGLTVPRQPFFEKELELVVSRAWGPGLFDARYAERGQDYPYAYARWTAGRNLAEFIEQVARGSVRLEQLVTHRFPIHEAPAAYELMTGRREPYLGIVLTYPAVSAAPGPNGLAAVPHQADGARRVELSRAPRSTTVPAGRPGLGLIGAGLFARTTLLPALKRVGSVELIGIATAGGVSAVHTGERHGFRYATTDAQDVIDDPEVSCVVIATRHDLHADLAAAALRAGKAVLVEKPVAVTREQMDRLITAWREAREQHGRAPRLMVGFNRRYSALAEQLRAWFRGVSEPIMVTCRVNAGTVPKGSWVHDPREGGGRIVGEMCHFVDLAQYLTGAKPQRVYAESLPSAEYNADENVLATLRMTTGSTASICYVANGSKGYPRERIEVFGGGRVGELDNFRRLTLVSADRRSTSRRWNIDRGYERELAALLSMAAGGDVPASFADVVATTEATFAIEESLRLGQPVDVESFLDVSTAS